MKGGGKEDDYKNDNVHESNFGDLTHHLLTQ